MTDYISQAEFREYIKDTSALDGPVIARCVTAASREVEQDCGRYFTQDGSVTAKYFDAFDDAHCELGDKHMAWDLSTATGLIVQTSTAADATYDATWTINTDFILEPINQAKRGITGWPYESIRAVGSRSFPRGASRFHRPPVKVTGKWGWAAVPPAVEQATLLMTNGFYARGQAPFGVAGFDAFGAVRVRSDPQYWSLLRPFIRESRLVA